ncbi:hypothetical protein ACFOVU_10930 [Nocardiopsis sediminis]|uniref:DUF4262 domain-containing protein n=1 Tax=Nocardiopsis sediminis TaxID=1778267 RepID=A0ABV8FMY6_9ACTN
MTRPHIPRVGLDPTIPTTPETMYVDVVEGLAYPAVVGHYLGHPTLLVRDGTPADAWGLVEEFLAAGSLRPGHILHWLTNQQVDPYDVYGANGGHGWPMHLSASRDVVHPVLRVPGQRARRPRVTLTAPDRHALQGERPFPFRGTP